MSKSVQPEKYMDGSDEVETHPAYGQIGISVVTGHAKLYGSALDSHGSFIQLRICRSERHHSLYRDWHFGRDAIIEVHMSHAQFAEMITTPNVGHGVPCTIDFHAPVAGPGDVPSIAESAQTEAAKVVASFSAGQEAFIEKLRRRADAVKAVLDKPSFTKSERRFIQGLLDDVLREVSANWPFAVEQFQEAAEKVVTQSKTEIEAFVTHAVRQLGLEKLSELQALLAPSSPLLEAKDSHE